MGDQGAPEQVLNRKPLAHLSELYPEVSYMEITDKRDGTKSIVGTRQTIRRNPLFMEVKHEGRTEVEIAAEIAHELDRRYEQALKYTGRPFSKNSGGIIVGADFHITDNREQRREVNKSRQRKGRLKAKAAGWLKALRHRRGRD